jgi:hypothetical protein
LQIGFTHAVKELRIASQFHCCRSYGCSRALNDHAVLTVIDKLTDAAYRCRFKTRLQAIASSSTKGEALTRNTRGQCVRPRGDSRDALWGSTRGNQSHAVVQQTQGTMGDDTLVVEAMFDVPHRQ